MTRILLLNLDIELYKLQILRSNSQALLFLDDFDPKCLGVPNLSKSHKSDMQLCFYSSCHYRATLLKSTQLQQSEDYTIALAFL